MSLEFQRIAYQLAQRRFARRVTFQQVQEPFINNLNVNIQIHNNITFNEIKGQEEEHIQETMQAIKQATKNIQATPKSPTSPNARRTHNRPCFSQVVGSSLESPIVPPSRVA
jgi:hypothetical protein